jgi:2'-5' RNA ligase
MIRELPFHLFHLEHALMKYCLEISENSTALWHVEVIKAFAKEKIDSGKIKLEAGDWDNPETPILVHSNNKKTLGKIRKHLREQCKKRGLPFQRRDFVIK